MGWGKGYRHIIIQPWVSSISHGLTLLIKTQFFSWGGGNVDLIYEPDFVELSFLGL